MFLKLKEVKTGMIARLGEDWYQVTQLTGNEWSWNCNAIGMDGQLEEFVGGDPEFTIEVQD